MITMPWLDSDRPRKVRSRPLWAPAPSAQIEYRRTGSGGLPKTAHRSLLSKSTSWRLIIQQLDAIVHGRIVQVSRIVEGVLSSNGYVLDESLDRLGHLDPVPDAMRGDASAMWARLRAEGYLYLRGQ